MIGYGFGAIVGSGVFGKWWNQNRFHNMFWINVSIF